MKDAYYFKHDSNARNDIKIKRLIKVYGLEGYGKYWILVEILREQDGYRLSLNSTKYPYAEVADELRCTEKEAKHFINDCIKEFHLLETDGQYLWSNSLLRRMAMWDEFREKQAQKAHKRWSKNKSNATAMPRQSRGNASIVKESKVKERKETLTSSEFHSEDLNLRYSNCPHQQIIELYHKILPELPKIMEWTPQRQAFLRARWKESKNRQNLAWWQLFFEKVKKSDFLMGRVKEFRADLEWLIRPKNFPKVLEGRYDNRQSEGGKCTEW